VVGGGRHGARRRARADEIGFAVAGRYRPGGERPLPWFRAAPWPRWQVGGQAGLFHTWNVGLGDPNCEPPFSKKAGSVPCGVAAWSASSWLRARAARWGLGLLVEAGLCRCLQWARAGVLPSVVVGAGVGEQIT
jgi:hypothetical protein